MTARETLTGQETPNGQQSLAAHEAMAGHDGTGGGDDLRIETGSVTHAGKVREENEDRCLVAPEFGVFAVADGMGGHEDGALASETVIEALSTIGVAVSGADLLARLEDRLLRANAALWSLGQTRGGIIGSTAAILIVFGRDFACLWSGDSRIYRIRAAAITQLTSDHTEARDLYERGVISAAERETWPRRHVLTKAMGVRPLPELEIAQGVAQAGDVFVLCSDGLTGHVADADILLAAGRLPAQAACDALLALTLERGAADNVTIVILRCGPGAAGAAVAATEASANATVIALPPGPAQGSIHGSTRESAEGSAQQSTAGSAPGPAEGSA